MRVKLVEEACVACKVLVRGRFDRQPGPGHSSPTEWRLERARSKAVHTAPHTHLKRGPARHSTGSLIRVSSATLPLLSGAFPPHSKRSMFLRRLSET
eukprot:scaffold106932_cov64-Phaeocystis_antarctica.AAC.9